MPKNSIESLKKNPFKGLEHIYHELTDENITSALAQIKGFSEKGEKTLLFLDDMTAHLKSSMTCFYEPINYNSQSGLNDISDGVLRILNGEIQDLASINNISSTTLSYVDATSSIQTQLDYLKNQTLSTNGGGTFMVYAELNGALNSSNSTCFQWSFGSGGVASSSQPQGLYIGISCNLISLYLNFNTYPNSNVTIGCLQNNTTIQSISVTTSQLNNNVTGLAYSFNAGDYINFRTISGTVTDSNYVDVNVSGTTTDPVLNFVLKRGETGATGSTPQLPVGNVTTSSTTSNVTIT
eukprot:gene15219-20503_t